MRNPRLLLYIALVIAVLHWIAESDTEAPLPLVKSDYQACTHVHTGPVQRPDGYDAHPFARKKDDA